MEIFNIFKEIALNITESGLSKSELILENYDKFITWIVGFSISIILLLLSNYNDVRNFINPNHLYIIKYCLISTIISSLFFRYFSTELRIKNTIAFERFKQQYSSFKLPDFNRSLNDISSYNDLKEFLKSDFNYELKNKIPIEDLHQVYENIRESYKKEYEISENYLYQSLRIAFELSEKQINNLKESNTNLYLQTYRFVTYILLFITNITFIATIVIIGMSI